MKVIHLDDVPKTIAHDDLIRQRFVAPGDLKSPVQTTNYVELSPGESFTPHRHPDCEECFFIIEGKAEASVNDKKFNLKAGDFVVIEAGEKHVYLNNSDSLFKYFQFRVLITK